eukprot:CAMPEP_0177460326 /NCGR_PEP_ID=MMETSP0369-20130122/14603_1 /TAXON_ID=447022 ORGANISM="Scrippsiella hangoei-like, Strain SHHI-4" /NCGR_SAMPLE_ID=MMETSP0369 /ASSEMBLY_ACC=CAM_ASM_000364 /LENGTH=176 /DNA_ID=CAMNT_0018933701 /DNA_START=83 /DNA_END=613 /DNA_ORIENTATION=+
MSPNPSKRARAVRKIAATEIDRIALCGAHLSWGVCSAQVLVRLRRRNQQVQHRDQASEHDQGDREQVDGGDEEDRVAERVDEPDDGLRAADLRAGQRANPIVGGLGRQRAAQRNEGPQGGRHLDVFLLRAGADEGREGRQHPLGHQAHRRHGEHDTEGVRARARRHDVDLRGCGQP